MLYGRPPSRAIKTSPTSVSKTLNETAAMMTLCGEISRPTYLPKMPTGRATREAKVKGQRQTGKYGRRAFLLSHMSRTLTSGPGLEN